MGSTPTSTSSSAGKHTTTAQAWATREVPVDVASDLGLGTEGVAPLAGTTPGDLVRWHVRLGHCSNDLTHRVADFVVGLPKLRGTLVCNDCRRGRSRAVVVDRGNKPKRRSGPGVELSADVFGPVRVLSKNGGHKYLLVVACKHTGYRWGFGMTHKSESLGILTTFFDMDGRGNRCSYFRTDGATEFKSKAFIRLIERAWDFPGEVSRVCSPDEWHR